MSKQPNKPVLLSEVLCPEDVRLKLALPENTKLVDAIDHMRTHKNVHVEVFLADLSSTKRAKKEKSKVEYIVRVSDDSGANISKFSDKSYIDCLVDGAEMAVWICF